MFSFSFFIDRYEGFATFFNSQIYFTEAIISERLKRGIKHIFGCYDDYELHFITNGGDSVESLWELKINYKNRTLTVDGHEYHEGDWISLNGSTGNIIEGKVSTIEPELSGEFAEIMVLSDKYATMQVRTNADSPKDAKIARSFGAQGIGLTRTEHMFFEEDRIAKMRKMIVAKEVEERKAAINELLPNQKGELKGM